MSDDNLLASRAAELSGEVNDERTDQEQIKMMGEKIFNGMMACIASTTANDFLMSTLTNLFAEGLPSGGVVNFAMLNTSYWLEAFIRSTPQRSNILQMEHSINLFIKKKESILFTL